ncbi:MAG: hypothetical protein PHD65_10265 [Gallionella sp.]|nr:hypothetical protein [Gallionella sp.]
MMYLGIDQSSELIYQGSSTFGACVVWPNPIVTPVSFVSTGEQELKLAKLGSSSDANTIFREDAFDPITRIRRGRFYSIASNGSTQEWQIIVVPPVQAFPGEINENRPDLARKTARTFYPCRVSTKISEAGGNQLLVALGTDQASTLWMVVNVETIHTGEELVTLKARQSFGVLPKIDWEQLPDKSGLVKGKIDELLNDVHRAGAESIVDRAREAATAILSAHLQSEGVAEASGKDLGALIDLLEKRNGKNSQRIVRCAAEIPQRLHSRVKHSEQEKHDNLRPIREQDAELAVQCIGVMLCDLGWGRWV